ncbi:MAG TPA: flagellar hook-associated protein FlgL [Actinophytocola sp.]|uniref:flagellar hook-associated protein FlgL n=1 Tax=Actinophytocola sp. TaxID=1872138 RepID=UPI002DB63D70|nr:flagellar hook-associated protein FlgL [Actinophytocola sp.]HEU5474199.1 flagellar hook-associated protein FlgL [Actinophytocola sp.]
MTFRVSEQSMSARVLTGLQRNQTRLEQLREQMASGKQISKPSDWPTGAAQALRLRGDLSAKDRYMRSATDGVSRLETAEGALNTASSMLNRARDLVLQGMSSPALENPIAREAIAGELAGLRDGLLSVANTTFLGRPVFGGTTAGSTAFDTTGSYVGDSGEVLRRIADNVQVRVDVPASAFGTGANQLFGVLDSIVANLRGNPSAVGSDLDRLDLGIESVNSALTAVGTRYSQLTAASDAAGAQSVRLGSELSELEDIDLVKSIIDLQSQSVGYEAALGATAKVTTPSLLDFLR